MVKFHDLKENIASSFLFVFIGVVVVVLVVVVLVLVLVLVVAVVLFGLGSIKYVQNIPGSIIFTAERRYRNSGTTHNIFNIL